MENTTVMTGFEGLDKVLGGYRTGTLNVIAGVPGMGKSALAVNIAANIAERGIPVVYYSLEMSKDDIESRLKKSGKTACSSKLIVDDDIALVSDPMKIKSEFMQVFDRSETKPGLVVIDYLQLLCMPGFEGKSRKEESAAINRELKLLAMECDVPILILSQLSRTCWREDHVPELADLGKYNTLYQDADSIVFIVRPSWYERCPSQPIEDAQLIVAKNRCGDRDVKVDVKWYRDKVMFADR